MSDISMVVPDHRSPDEAGEFIDDAQELSAREFRGLRYPFGRWVPQPGEVREVAAGVFWLRMPLPMSLNHINLYVLDDGDGWAIVDTGLNTEVTKELWEKLVAGPFAGRPITRVLCTHYHPDHLGLAGWLCARFNVALWIPRTEYLFAKTLVLDVAKTVPEEIIKFYRAAAWPEAALDIFRDKGWGNFGKAVVPLPQGFRRIQGGDVLQIGAHKWRVVIGRGHAPEHACLVCDTLKVMISGDQVLPRITSNVSVYPTEPYADPLGDWMESLDMLETLDPDLFVLPAHNEPFYNLHVRARQLREDHLDKLSRLVDFCRSEKRTVLQSFEILFRRPVPTNEMMMATGEAIAHYHYLEARGKVKSEKNDGVSYFYAS
jgi:glyoxylase-like metal-dependent hydrolase (beta-lactamase superfamily II)